MTLMVLQERQQITDARQKLMMKGASAIESELKTWLRKAGLVRGIKIGDMAKSWDVLATIAFIESNLKKDDSVLDIGCFASEVVVALHKLGYTRLAGADLNPVLAKMPYQDSIDYQVVNFKNTKFADSSFNAITSISVIEHDFEADSLLREVARLLKPGGYFIASFDYWPEKIDTTGTRFFDMDWKIFSKKEESDFVVEAEKFGLMPVGDLNYSAKDKTINCAGKDYTFGWLVLKKMV